MSYDLLYGRAGFLWAALFLNRYLGEGTVPDHLLSPIVAAILSGGRVGAADHQACPLLYRQLICNSQVHLFQECVKEYELIFLWFIGSTGHGFGVRRMD